LGVGITTLPCKNENVEKPPEIRPDSTFSGDQLGWRWRRIDGRRLWRRPREEKEESLTQTKRWEV
jgi:hypothetical protein